MPTFLWEGKTAQGRLMKGDLEAPNVEAVFSALRERRIRPIPNRIRQKGQGLDKEISIPGFGEKVKPKEVSLFTRQFATMIDAGLPICSVWTSLASNQLVNCSAIPFAELGRMLREV